MGCEAAAGVGGTCDHLRGGGSFRVTTSEEGVASAGTYFLVRGEVQRAP